MIQSAGCSYYVLGLARIRVVFQTRRFLIDHFGNAPGLLAFLGAYDAPCPNPAAAEKWFQRASVPSEWFSLVLSYLEIDHGKPVSLIPYLQGTTNGQ